MSKFSYLNDELEALERDNMLRQCVCVEPDIGVNGVFGREKSCKKMLFCANNYLSAAQNDLFLTSVRSEILGVGYGSCGSRLISGTSPQHVKVEREYADFFRKESSLLFNSGWVANEAVLKTLPGEGDIVLLDKFDHASIIDAASAGKAKFRTYRRDNLGRLEKYLADDRYKQKYIVTESVFSMDGCFADLKALVDLKNKYGAILIVDEAHGVGCFGARGEGLAEEMGLLDEVDILIAPLGKAPAVSGAIVASEKCVCDYLVNKARAFIYTTACSPANCVAISASLEFIKSADKQRQQLKDNSKYLRDKLAAMGFDTGGSVSHIVPVIIGDAGRTLEISKQLFEAGFFVSAIRPPTVAVNSSRLRISMQADHTFEQIDLLCDALWDIDKG